VSDPTPGQDRCENLDDLTDELHARAAKAAGDAYQAFQEALNMAGEV
jgi:hypothetical protein